MGDLISGIPSARLPRDGRTIVPGITQPVKNVLNPMDDEMAERILTSRLFIINICDREHWVNRSFGVYHIEACKPGEISTSLEVNGRILPIDIGDDKIIETENKVRAIAEDICQEINDHITAAPNAKPFMGVFISETPVPSKQALAEAHKKLTAFQLALVEAADRLWDNPKTHNEINELHRWAGRAQKMAKAWLYQEQQGMSTCPACGSTVKPNIAKCPQCHAVLSKELLKQYFPLEHAELQKLEKAAKSA